MMAREDMPVLNIAQLSCIAALLDDWGMAFSALISGLDLESHPPILRLVVELFGGWRKC